MIDVLAPLVKSPFLKDYVAQLENILMDENDKRVDFYNSISEKDKAEFINGEVIFHSPVTRGHLFVSQNLMQLMKAYVDVNELGEVHAEKAMIALSRNDYEPDLCFFSKEKSASFNDDQKLFPAPNLVVEIISKSTEKNDRGVKFNDYSRHGIEEYWIVNPGTKIFEQYLLRNSKYQLLFKGKSGNVESFVIKGFVFPVKAIFDRKENSRLSKKMLGK